MVLSKKMQGRFKDSGTRIVLVFFFGQDCQRIKEISQSDLPTHASTFVQCLKCWFYIEIALVGLEVTCRLLSLVLFTSLYNLNTYKQLSNVLVEPIEEIWSCYNVMGTFEQPLTSFSQRYFLSTSFGNS